MNNSRSRKQNTKYSESEFFTIAELCQRWKVSEMFIIRMWRANRLPAYKIGAAAVRFAVSDILRIEQEAAA